MKNLNQNKQNKINVHLYATIYYILHGENNIERNSVGRIYTFLLTRNVSFLSMVARIIIIIFLFHLNFMKKVKIIS